MFKSLFAASLTVMFSYLPAFAGNALSAGIAYENRIKSTIRLELSKENPDSIRLMALRELLRRLTVDQINEYDRASNKIHFYCSDKKAFVKEWNTLSKPKDKTAKELMRVAVIDSQYLAYALTAKCD